MKNNLSRLLILILTLTAMCSLLGYLGAYHWMLDMLSHFKLQYLIILTTGTILLYFLKKNSAIIYIIFIVITAMEVLPVYYGGNKLDTLSTSVKIVCINLLSSNDDSEKVIQFIDAKLPDIVVLQEYTNRWQNQLEPKLSEYQCRLTVPRDDNFGIAVFSKIHLSGLEQKQIGNAGLPSVTGNFKVDNTDITLIASHPLPPVGSHFFDQRNLQLEQLGRLVAGAKNEVVLVGDLNISSFSTHFKQLISNSGLSDSRKGFGLLTTWPTWFGLAQTTLDHCLISNDIGVKAREVGDNIGSDHLPILVEIGMK